MIKMYQTDIETNMMREINTFERGCWINMTSPSEAEIKRVCEYANIQEDFIRYSLDSEEKARIDYEEDDDTILFILDVPTREKEE